MRIGSKILLRKLPIGIAMLLCVNSQVDAKDYQCADTLMVLSFSSSLYDTNYGLYTVDKKGGVSHNINPVFKETCLAPPKRGDEIVAKLDSYTGNLVVYRNLTVERLRDYFVKKQSQKSR
ncbi:MAG: hypothetical protein IKW67_02210 [Alphaproteobacteria bacterium]|nr:hypothetical protein [Alphaproteobacteria bacterium]